VANENSRERVLANKLNKAGYAALFQYGERNMADSIWQKGENKDTLKKIADSSEFEDYTRC